MSVSGPAEKAGMRKATQNRSRAKQEKLIAAAQELVAERGFEDVKIADITARADCAVGTAYYLFGNKEGLFTALKDRFIEAANAGIGTMPVRPEIRNAPLGYVMDEVVRTTLIRVRNNEGFLRAAMARSAAQPEEWRDFRALVNRMQHSLADTLGPRLKEIPHPDPTLAVGFALQLLFSACANAMLNDPGPLRLQDAAFEAQLKRMMRAYLGL